MPSGNGALSSSGSVGICPVTKIQPSAATAWLNGATGVGASATIRNSIIYHSPCRTVSIEAPVPALAHLQLALQVLLPREHGGGLGRGRHQRRRPHQIDIGLPDILGR